MRYSRRVYDLRHACASTWLNGGVPPAQVAEWAGHSVSVLLKVYAKCIVVSPRCAQVRPSWGTQGTWETRWVGCHASTPTTFADVREWTTDVGGLLRGPPLAEPASLRAPKATPQRRTNMSEQTAQELEEAKALEMERRTEVEGQKRECLAAVARGIPARVEEVTRRVAYSRPEVAKELGSDGINGLRTELADAAAVIASEIEAAAGQIVWPRPQYSQFSQVRPRNIESACSSSSPADESTASRIPA